MGDENSMEGSILGFPFKMKGALVIIIVVMLGTAGMLYWEIQKQSDRVENQYKEFKKQHDQLQEALTAQLYVMCIGNAECKKWDLEMPETLRKMQRR